MCLHHDSGKLQIITYGKKGNLPAFRRANAFLLKPALVPKVFNVFAERYANRPGGYTRIHKFGNRPGDNAPHAILELVDNPRDLRFEMTARAVGWELLGKRLGSDSPLSLANSGIQDMQDVISQERNLQPAQRGELRPKTRWNLQKVLRYRKEDAVPELVMKAENHVVRFTSTDESNVYNILSQDTLLAQPLAAKELVGKDSGKTEPSSLSGLNALRLKAGQTVPGGSRSTLHLAQGALGREPSGRPRWFERRKLGIDKTAIWDQL